jgi:phosphoribosylformylglycinamidine synthase subunit PurSL
MAWRININRTIPDARAETKKHFFATLGLQGQLQSVEIVDSYSSDAMLSDQELNKIALMLTNPLTEEAVLQEFSPQNSFNWLVEIGFLPGVTDNVGNTIKENIEDLLNKKLAAEEGVYSSTAFFLSGNLNQSDIEKIADSLYNPLIQRALIKNYNELMVNGSTDIVIPKVKLTQQAKVDQVDLEISDSELEVLGKQGIKDADGTRRGPLALDLEYLRTIQSYFKTKNRVPTDIELESIAQTWSEHCKHTIFADPIDDVEEGLFKTYIKAATEKIRRDKGDKDFCFSVFVDNSGAIEFDENYLISDKVETHNSPSALDPFGGSITGIVGVNRDTLGFGLGAKPILNRYGFCFAPPDDQTVLYKGKNKTQKMLSAKRIMSGVIDGVNVGGNNSGIPTPQGFLFFDKRFRGKPLVFVGTIGLIPKTTNSQLSYEKKAQPGDQVVVIGGRVGLDGIHGATFSSEAMDSGSPATAVQIGDPITQKKLSDALIKEARDEGLYHSITDNGAGGLSCSVAEMAKESGGCSVQLEKVPLKYPGLAPWQTWISESQERMTLAVPPDKLDRFKELMQQRGVEATVLGKFTDSGKCKVTYHGETIMDIDLGFLHDGLPARHLRTTYSPTKHKEPQIPIMKDLTNVLQHILVRPNIASFAFISEQFDHEVQGSSVLKPLQGRGRVNGLASVIRPVLDSAKGVVVSQGLYPGYSDIDTYHMAACSIDTAIRNTISVGGDLDHLALLDNFCWCSSSEPERLGQLKRAAQACYDYAVVFGTPFISGKDSMFNDFKGYDHDGQPVKVSIPPTLLISSIGVIKDVNKIVSLDVKFPGDLIYILGETHDELGASEYFAWWSEFSKRSAIGNSVPQVKTEKNIKLYRQLTQAIENNLIASSISLAQGGLGIALAKMAMAGKLGIDVSLQNLPGTASRDDFALFSESQGRLVVTTSPDSKQKFESLFKGLPIAYLGQVTHDNLINIQGLNSRIRLPVQQALSMYHGPFKDY